MTNIRRGVDYSMWQKLLHPSLHWALWQQGVRLEVIGAWHGNQQNMWARANMENALKVQGSEDMRIATYGIVHRWKTAREHVEQMVAACGNYWEQCEVAAIDVEMETTVGQILEAERVIKECGGRPVLYMANWVFGAGLVKGDLRLLKHIPPWYADYSKEPELEMWAPHLTRIWGDRPAIGHQYTGTTPFPSWEMEVLLGIAGINTTIDWNIFDWDFITEGDMTPGERQRLKEAEDRQRWAGLVSKLEGHALAGTRMPVADMGAIYNMLEMALEGRDFPSG